MYTDSEEYKALLYRIQDQNMPSLAVLAPSYEPFFEIDLNTRTIITPKILSVKTDHQSEIIYFKVARWYDNIDLTTMCCIIQYINAAGEGRVYPVPYYDVDTCSTSEKEIILFPWVVDQEATKAAGTVKFSVRFFRLDDQGKYLVYNLNTLPASVKVEKGLDMKYDEVYREVELTASTYKKNTYYILRRSGIYELATGEFDSQVRYYLKTTLQNDKTDFAASFMEQLVHYAQQASENQLTWIVL